MFQAHQNGDQAQPQHQNCIIHPDNWIYRMWCWALVVLSFYLCFISTMLSTFSAPPPYSKIINSVINVFFIVDGVLSFFVAYRDKTTFALVNDRKRIATKAIKPFIQNVVLFLPFEWFTSGFPSSRLEYQICRALALLRFFCYIRIHSWFSELEEDENINYVGIGIAKMIWVCCLVCHYGGCVFYLMASFHSNDVKKTWFSLLDPGFVNRGFITKYVNSIYYAVISFTTVGYGDLHPVYIDEKVFSIIFLLIDFALVAYITTTIIYLVVPDVGPLGKYRARRVRVLEFCRRNNLPDNLCTEVSSQLRLEYQSQSQPSEENGILESLPISVRGEILIALSNSVTNSNMFSCLSNPIRFQMIQAMEPIFFPANTNIILENEAPTFLYFLVRGSVDLIFPEDIVKIVGPGAVFGETCVLFNTAQVFTAITREWSQLLMLDRGKLISILEGYPNDLSHMISGYIEKELPNQNNAYLNRVLMEFERKVKLHGRTDLPISLWFAVERGYDILFDQVVGQFWDSNGCDGEGRTAMHLVALKGDAAKVTSLLENGADPNFKDLLGNVPLWNALSNGHENVAQVLVTRGCTLDGCPIGYYACNAASTENIVALEALRGIDIGFLSVPNNQGKTALHVAWDRKIIPVVRYLVDSGVPIDLNGADENGSEEELLNYLDSLDMLFNQY